MELNAQTVTGPSIWHGYSASYVIFHKLFLVRMKTIDGYSKEYIEAYGLPFTGDKRMDNAFASEIINKNITIAQMADYYKQGISIRLTSEKDILEIYDTIHQHIKDFNNEVHNSLGFNKIPIEDLRVLSDFASTLYEHIANYRPIEYYQKDPVRESGYDGNINNIFNIEDVYLPKPKSVMKKEEEEEANKHYQDTSGGSTHQAPHLGLMTALEERSKYMRQPFPIQSQKRY